MRFGDLKAAAASPLRLLFGLMLKERMLFTLFLKYKLLRNCFSARPQNASAKARRHQVVVGILGAAQSGPTGSLSLDSEPGSDLQLHHINS